MYQAYLKRDSKSFNGILSLIKRDEAGKPIESESLRNIPVYTGVSDKYEKSFDWVTGQGGIPEGTWFIWITNPEQAGQLDPQGKEIGHAYHISSSTINKFNLVNSKTGKVRFAIMIHPDNAIPGSIGCIVLPNTKQGRADFKKIVAFFKKAEKEGIKHITLKVYR